MRILHVSDLHFSGLSDSIHGQQIEKFLLDVAKHGPYDFVAFTGDLTSAGKRDQFEGAKTSFVLPLMSACSVAVENLIFVPGNHDLDRDSIDEYRDLGLR